jgi:hypothetical protein
MQFDLTATPPRTPQPTGLIVNPQTGHIDFSLAGTPIPDDCTTQMALTQAQCQFDQFLQTLDGFPSVTPASAPASAALDPATLTLGQNVVVVGVKEGTGLVTNGLQVGFDSATSSLSIVPMQPWVLGELYWIGVRGYANGVRAAGGQEVVGSPTMALLKQDTTLTCGAADPAHVDPSCPAYQVLVQGSTPALAAMQLFQLEAIRLAYQSGGGFDAMAAAGLDKPETAVLWGFPIQTSSVALLVPPSAAVPQVPAPDHILVGVQGTVDPATVVALSPAGQAGPVVVADLTALAAGDMVNTFPPVTASYAAPAIVIAAAAPFARGHEVGLFFTNGLHDTKGAPLVPSPASVLLTLTAPLVDSAGHSTVSGVSDADATTLEAGRQALAPVLDSPAFTALTGISRADLVYTFAFIPVQP